MSKGWLPSPVFPPFLSWCFCWPRTSAWIQTWALISCRVQGSEMPDKNGKELKGSSHVTKFQLFIYLNLNLFSVLTSSWCLGCVFDSCHWQSQVVGLTVKSKQRYRTYPFPPPPVLKQQKWSRCVVGVTCNEYIAHIHTVTFSGPRSNASLLVVPVTFFLYWVILLTTGPRNISLEVGVVGWFSFFTKKKNFYSYDEVHLLTCRSR